MTSSYSSSIRHMWVRSRRTRFHCCGWRLRHWQKVACIINPTDTLLTSQYFRYILLVGFVELGDLKGAIYAVHMKHAMCAQYLASWRYGQLIRYHSKCSKTLDMSIWNSACASYVGFALHKRNKGFLKRVMHSACVKIHGVWNMLGATYIKCGSSCAVSE